MAIRGIYNADGNTTYTVADFKLLNSKILGGKIVLGENALKVSAQTSPNMTVKVSAGECSINGPVLQNTTSYNVTIESNSASYSRVDAIVAYISGTAFQIKVLKGTPSSSPSAPTTTASYYLKLAEVIVGVGVTSIQESNIKDCRNENAVINSLSEYVLAVKAEVDDMKQYKVNHADISADRGYRLEADGYCRAWNSGIQNISGNALSITVTVPYTFKNKASCSVTARFTGSNNIPINIIARMDSGNTVMLYYPANSIPQLANGNGSWFICVEGY